MSLPVRGAWVEIACNYWGQGLAHVSLPVRGAWVEIIDFVVQQTIVAVAPRAGSVG